MYDHGKLIGRFYFDSHPRPGKYEHANAVPLRAGVGSSIPVAALVMNLPAGKGLMEHGDVVTFLHEYGHLLHYIFGGPEPALELSQRHRDRMGLRGSAVADARKLGLRL